MYVEENKSNRPGSTAYINITNAPSVSRGTKLYSDSLDDIVQIFFNPSVTIF